MWEMGGIRDILHQRERERREQLEDAKQGDRHRFRDEKIGQVCAVGYNCGGKRSPVPQTMGRCSPESA